MATLEPEARSARLSSISQEGDPTMARARIYMAGDPTLPEVTAFLWQLQQSYGEVETLFQPPTYVLRRIFSTSSSRLSEEVGSPLILVRVSLESPGFWEVLGSLNPLKVLVDYLAQRHEREKDREYRNREEELKLILENAERENEVLQDRITMLREAGFPPEEIRVMLRLRAAIPLRALGNHVDTKLIQGAEIVDEQEAA